MKQERKIKERKMRRGRRTKNSIGEGTKEKPRVVIFRSNVHMHVQIIDDESGKTLLSASTKILKEKGTKSEQAKKIGLFLAKNAKEKNISQMIFDRGAYKYHGRVRAVAVGLREGGIKI